MPQNRLPELVPYALERIGGKHDSLKFLPNPIRFFCRRPAPLPRSRGAWPGASSSKRDRRRVVSFSGPLFPGPAPRPRSGIWRLIPRRHGRNWPMASRATSAAARIMTRSSPASCTGPNTWGRG